MFLSHCVDKAKESPITNIPLFSNNPAEGASSTTSAADQMSAVVDSLSILGAAPCPPSSATSPILLSSALPPIPAKVAEKIKAGQFIDFKELLVDNIALLQRLSELGMTQAGHSLMVSSRLREVQDPLSWVSCFLAFVAAKVDSKETQELAAYEQIIIHLARKHSHLSWYALFLAY